MKNTLKVIKKYVEKIYEHIDIPNKSKNNVYKFFQVKGIYLVEIRVKN